MRSPSVVEGGGAAHPRTNQWRRIDASFFFIIIIFYEALNNKKAISGGADNEVGHRRRCGAIIIHLGVIYSRDGGPDNLPDTDNLFQESGRIYRAAGPQSGGDASIYFQAFSPISSWSDGVNEWDDFVSPPQSSACVLLLWWTCVGVWAVVVVGLFCFLFLLLSHISLKPRWSGDPAWADSVACSFAHLPIKRPDYSRGESRRLSTKCNYTAPRNGRV